MAILRHAMLCNAASAEASGLVSMLGAFIDRISGPQLPVRGQVWFVARIDWEESDFDTQHSIVIKVLRADDGEQIARVDGGASSERPPKGQFEPDMPIGANLAVPLPMEFRRAGFHRVILEFDAETIAELPLKVTTQLPQV